MDTHDTTQRYLRALLSGEALPALPAGPWAATLDQLTAIEDLAGRRRAFEAAATAHPRLRQMLNGGHVAAPQLRPAVVTATDVLRMQFPDLRWVVPGLLPEGLTLLAGRPKQGKSWITLQIALSVATGGLALGETVPQGKALILALEDGYRRLKDRMLAQHWPDPCDGVEYVISLDEMRGRLDGPGLAALDARIVEGQHSYVVVDTFARAVGVSDLNDMAETTTALKGLQELATRRRVSVVVVHHTNKMGGDDFLDTVAGSTGLTAVADGIMVLKRKRGEHTATLQVVHRDLGAERNIALAWDHELACWQATGDAASLRREHDARDILQAIRALTQLGEAATPAKIGEIVERNRGSVFRDLPDLLTRGLILRVGRRGAYSLTQDGTHALEKSDADE